MDRRRNDPAYQAHEPEQPQDDERLSAEEYRERSLERENLPRAVQQRQNMNQPPPSAVRDNTPDDTP